MPFGETQTPYRTCRSVADSSPVVQKSPRCSGCFGEKAGTSCGKIKPTQLSDTGKQLQADRREV